LAEVQVHDGESLESALKRFKRKVLQEDIIKEIKRHAFYLKPGQKKRVKQARPSSFPWQERSTHATTSVSPEDADSRYCSFR
jgi:small subunit ribosomal protein S21